MMLREVGFRPEEGVKCRLVGERGSGDRYVAFQRSILYYTIISIHEKKGDGKEASVVIANERSLQYTPNSKYSL